VCPAHAGAYPLWLGIASIVTSDMGMSQGAKKDSSMSALALLDFPEKPVQIVSLRSKGPLTTQQSAQAEKSPPGLLGERDLPGSAC
jgi:hypothetical protein